MAHRDGLAAKVDDLDQVRMAGPFTLVIVVASMDRGDSTGGHRILGLHVHGVEHRPSPSGGRCLFIHRTAVRRARSSGKGPRPHDKRRSVNRVKGPKSTWGYGDHGRLAATRACLLRVEPPIYAAVSPGSVEWLAEEVVEGVGDWFGLVEVWDVPRVADDRDARVGHSGGEVETDVGTG